MLNEIRLQNTEFQCPQVKQRDSLKQEWERLIEEIYDKSPDGSFFSGRLQKVRSGYKMVVTVCFNGGQIIAEGIHRSAKQTFKVLESQIWDKIRNWRKNRFTEE